MRDPAPQIVRQRLLIEGLYTADVDRDFVESSLSGVAAHLDLRLPEACDPASSCACCSDGDVTRSTMRRVLAPFDAAGACRERNADLLDLEHLVYRHTQAAA